MKKCLEEWIENTNGFIALWKQLEDLYLKDMKLRDIDHDKEAEFLRFKAKLMENLPRVTEIMGDRLDLKDSVTSLINDAVTLEVLHAQSGYQLRHVREKWEEISEKLDGLIELSREYDPKQDRESRLAAIKRANPFWEPDRGGLRRISVRLAAGPVTFFEGLKIAGNLRELRNMQKHLATTLFIGSALILLVLALLNLSLTSAIPRNLSLEMGLVEESRSFPAILIIVFVAAVLFVLSSCVLTSAGMLILSIFARFMHAGFSIAGTHQTFRATSKMLTYSFIPAMLIITLPYVVVLQLIGAVKVLRLSKIRAFIGWASGILLSFILTYILLGGALYFTGSMPKIGDKYAVVTASEARLIRNGKVVGKARRRERFIVTKESKKYFWVKKDKKQVQLLRKDTRENEVVFADLPGLVINTFLTPATAQTTGIVISNLFRHFPGEL